MSLMMLFNPFSFEITKHDPGSLRQEPEHFFWHIAILYTVGHNDLLTTER